MSAVHDDRQAVERDALERFRASLQPIPAARSFQAFMATISSAPSPTVAVPLHPMTAGIGTRNTNLAQLAGRWFAKGLENDDVIVLAKAWNNQLETPLEEAELLTTVNSISRANVRNHGYIPEPTRAFTLADCRIDRFLKTDPPPRKWLLENFIPQGIVGLIVAAGGTGKSMLLTQLGVSVGTGIPLAGKWQVSEPGSVLMLLAEDDNDEIHRRLANVMNSLALEGYAEEFAKLSDRLFIRSMVGANPLLTTKIPSGECVRTGLVESLLEMVKGLPDLKLIVFDPASRFRGGIENSAEDTTRFVEALEALAVTTGATVLIAHHVSKGGANSDEASQHASRGSSALIDGSRWSLQLAPPSKRASLQSMEEFADIKRRTLIATVVKSNYGLIPEPVTLMRGQGGYLRHIESDEWSRIAKRSVYQSILQLLLKSEKKYSKAAFANEHGGVKKAFKIGIKQLQSDLTDMVELGYLVAETGKGRSLVLTEKGREVAAK